MSVVALVALAAALYAAYFIRLDNDGMLYSLVADQILKGRGLRTPAFGAISLYLPPRPDSAGTWPDTWETPLLPTLFALMRGVRPGHIWPAQVVNVCAHLLSSLLAFLIAFRCAGLIAGVSAGIAMSIWYTPLIVVGQVWTEALFISLSVLTVGLLQASRGRKDNRGFLLGSGCAALAACAARTIGIVLLPLFLWEALRSWKRSGIRDAVRTVLLTLPVPLSFVVAWISRNMVLRGVPTGVPFPPTHRSLGAVFEGVMSIIAEQFTEGDIRSMVLQAGMLLGIPTMALLIIPQGRRAISRLLGSGLDLVLLAAALYAGLLMYAFFTTQPVFEPRHATPLVPWVLIAAAAVIVSGWETIGRVRLRLPGGLICMVGSLALMVVHGAARSIRSLPHSQRGKEFGIESDSCQWVMSHIKPGSILVTNVPYTVSFFTGIHTMNPMYRHSWNAFERLPPDLDKALVQKMEELNARYVLLIRVTDGQSREAGDNFEKGLPAEVWGEFVARLSRGEDTSGRFEKVYECPRGVVYKLRD